MNSKTITSRRERAIYVGSRKMVALAAEMGGDQPRIERYAVEYYPEGFESGLVVNLERATASVERILKKLGDGGADTADGAFYVVLGNAKIKLFTYSSSLYFRDARRPVTQREIRAVIEQTRAVATLPLAESVLQAVPESFLVDDMAGIVNPIGLEAERLGVSLNVFTLEYQALRNLQKVFDAAEIEVDGYYPKALTVPEAVLTPEEKKEGAVLIDVADDMTEIGLWANGRYRGMRTVASGGKQLTEKVAAAWKVEFRDAEKVKERFGGLEEGDSSSEELIPLVERNGKQEHPVRRREFKAKLQELAKTWMSPVADEVRVLSEKEGVFHPHFVFTGGGARLDGFLEFVQKHFGLEGRVGCARKIDAPNELLVDPAMTGACGMCRWSCAAGREYERLTAPRGFMEKTLMAVRGWFSNYF